MRGILHHLPFREPNQETIAKSSKVSTERSYGAERPHELVKPEIKAQITKEQHISSEAVPLTRVLQAMERAGDEANIVILDACRNNPFLGSFRSVTRGLAP